MSRKSPQPEDVFLGEIPEKSQSPKKTTPEYRKTTKVTRKAKTAPIIDAPIIAEPYDDDDLVPIVKTSKTKKRTPIWKRFGRKIIHYGKTVMNKLNNKEQQSKAVEDWTNERKAQIKNKDQNNDPIPTFQPQTQTKKKYFKWSPRRKLREWNQTRKNKKAYKKMA